MLKILNELFLFAFLLFLIIGADGITETFLNGLGVKDDEFKRQNFNAMD